MRERLPPPRGFHPAMFINVNNRTNRNALQTMIHRYDATNVTTEALNRSHGRDTRKLVFPHNKSCLGRESFAELVKIPTRPSVHSTCRCSNCSAPSKRPTISAGPTPHDSNTLQAHNLFHKPRSQPAIFTDIIPPPWISKMAPYQQSPSIPSSMPSIQA